MDDAVVLFAGVVGDFLEEVLTGGHNADVGVCLDNFFVSHLLVIVC